MKHLDKVANLAIIVGVVVFLFVVVRGQLLTSRAAPPPAQQDTSAKALVGKTITIPGLKSPLQRDTLVLAISETCRYCRESLPFYQKLALEVQGKLDFIAVLPQPADEAKAYLHDAGVPTGQVISADLGCIGVHATPTLLLLKPSGFVKGAWVGLLGEDSQKRVLAAASR